MIKDYCIIKAGKVSNIIAMDETLVSTIATGVGESVVERSSINVQIGHFYKDSKFVAMVNDVCAGGITHSGQTEPCVGGEILISVHEEEII